MGARPERLTLSDWLRLVYAGNATGGSWHAPALALQLLADHPHLAEQGDARR